MDVDKIPEIKLPKIQMPKLSEIPGKIVSKFKEYGRVLRITKKPDTKEYSAIVKASGLGILIIGFIGFIIHMIVQGLKLMS